MHNLSISTSRPRPVSLHLMIQLNHPRNALVPIDSPSVRQYTHCYVSACFPEYAWLTHLYCISRQGSLYRSIAGTSPVWWGTLSVRTLQIMEISYSPRSEALDRIELGVVDKCEAIVLQDRPMRLSSDPASGEGYSQPL